VLKNRTQSKMHRPMNSKTFCRAVVFLAVGAAVFAEEHAASSNAPSALFATKDSKCIVELFIDEAPSPGKNGTYLGPRLVPDSLRPCLNSALSACEASSGDLDAAKTRVAQLTLTHQNGDSYWMVLYSMPDSDRGICIVFNRQSNTATAYDNVKIHRLASALRQVSAKYAIKSEPIFQCH
jgi:hypothetical protein